jgi:hypothetical protein
LVGCFMIQKGISMNTYLYMFMKFTSRSLLTYSQAMAVVFISSDNDYFEWHFNAFSQFKDANITNFQIIVPRKFVPTTADLCLGFPITWVDKVLNRPSSPIQNTEDGITMIILEIFLSKAFWYRLQKAH